MNLDKIFHLKENNTNVKTEILAGVTTFMTMAYILAVNPSILSATVTAFAGPVSFVGIAVPHMIKQLFKTAKPIVVIPGCFLGGAVFCLFSDLLARTLFSPTELSISSVTAVFGAPVVIAMMIKRVKR